MNSIDIVTERIWQKGGQPALFWNGKRWSYDDFHNLVDSWIPVIEKANIGSGSVVGILSDYTPQTCALFWALILKNAILVPFTRAIEKEMPSFMEIAGVQHLFRFDRQDNWTLDHMVQSPQSPLVEEFRTRGTPGLIVFSSGSTGKPKGILHDIERVMRKFTKERQGWRTVLFLMMDHFGGFNTLLSTFAYGGVGVCVNDRKPEAVCRAIQESNANLLPTTPTFLNLLIASGSYKDFNLASIELITYGTEVMSETTLQKVKEIFPNAQIKQTYGLSEVGVLRSKSESDASVWVKIGGEGFEVKIIDNILYIRSEANMVGYLNAPSPFDEEGWMCTGDHVEVKEDYMRILGRKSEMINVGGQKVFPVEVENVLLQADNVLEAAVFGRPHPMMGQVVTARVTLREEEDPQKVTERLRKFCLERMARYKVPVRFIIANEDEIHSERFKKIRKESQP